MVEQGRMKGFLEEEKILIFGSGLILLPFHHFNFIPISIQAELLNKQGIGMKME